MSYVRTRPPVMLGEVSTGWLVGAGVIALAILGMSFGGGGHIERNPRRRRKTSRRRSRRTSRRRQVARNTSRRTSPGKWAVSWRLGGKDDICYFEQRRAAERWHDFLRRTQSNASNIQLFDAGLIHEMFPTGKTKKKKRTRTSKKNRRRSRRRLRLNAGRRRTARRYRRRRYTSLMGR